MRRLIGVFCSATCAAFLMTSSLMASSITWHAYGVHGGSVSESAGQITAVAGNTAGETPEFHWNKSGWETRTGEKAFYVTSDLNGLPVGAISEFEWDFISGYWGNAYFNIMVQDANGKRAILAPSLNSGASAGWDTDSSDDGAQKPYAVFEAEIGWTGTAATGWYAANWDEVKTLIIADGPFTEFPDTLLGEATAQGDAVYSIANWAAWADQAAGSDADWEKAGVMVTFGQSTGAAEDTTVIENLRLTYHVNSIASATLVFEGALTVDGSGYAGTIAMTKGNYFCETCPGADEYIGGGSYVPGPEQGGFDVYALEGGSAHYDDIFQGTIGADHDAYSSGGGWGAYYQPDCADWEHYELTLDAGRWYLRYNGGTLGAGNATPMSGVMNWDSMYAAETDTGAYLTPGSDPDANDGGALALITAATGAITGAGWWDMDWSWGSEAIPLELPGFSVAVTDIGGGIYRVTLTPAPVTEVWVDDDFDSSTPGWGVTHFDSIQDGIDAVSGSTVHVAAGTYEPATTIDIPTTGLVLVGAGSDQTFIKSSTASPLITVAADNVTIQDLELTDDAELREGIRVVTGASAGLTVSHVDVTNLGNTGGANAYGINVTQSFDGLTVAHCDFIAMPHTAYTRSIGVFTPNHLDLTDFEVDDCDFEGIWTGVYLRSAIDGLDLTGNRFSFLVCDGAACTAGLYIGDGDDDHFDIENVTVTGNTFTDYNRGVYVWEYGANTTIDNFVISGNTFNNSIWSSGIRFIIGLNGMEDYTVGGITIDDNVFTQHTDVGANVALVDLRTYDATLLDCDVAVTNNQMTFTGGPYATAMYGVQFFLGGSPFYNATMSGNVLDGGNIGGSTSKGVQVFHYSDDYTWTSSLDLDIVNNRITGFDDGITIYDATNGGYGGLPAGTDVVVSGNDLGGNVYGVHNDAGAMIDASGNWWGDLAPSDNVTINVDYTPWLGLGDDTSADPGFQGDFSVLYVDDDSPQTGSLAYIAEALGLVSGSTINVAPGIYEEQIHITMGDLKLIGSGSGDDSMVDTIIQSPTALTWYYETSAKNYPIVGIDNATGVEVRDLRVDGLARGNGNYRFQGIGFWNAGGTVADCAVVNVQDTPFSGSQHGVGIYSYNNTGGPYTINLTNVDVVDYQKGGIALNGAGVTANVVGCSTEGIGATSTTAQNGIQMYGIEGGTIDDCHVTGNIYTGSGWAASGLLLWSTDSVVLTDTTIIDGDPAVYCQETNLTASGLVISNPDPDAGNGFYLRDQAGMGSKMDSGFAEAEYPAQPFGDYEDTGEKDRGTMTATLADSVITGHWTDGYGISASNYVAADTIELTVTGCTITEWAYGFVVFGSGGDVHINAQQSAIYGNQAGFYSALPGQVAINNWWGDATGPWDNGGTIAADPLNCASVGDIINDSGLGDYVWDEVVEYCPWKTSYQRLQLLSDDECYLDGDTVTVVLSMNDVPELIRGGQFFMEYDASKLAFVSAVPSTAFPAEVEEVVDEVAGTIVYAVGIGMLGGTPVSGDADMATLTFEAIGPLCELPGVIDWMPHTPPTRLTGAQGGAVYPALINLDIIDDAGPVIDCPVDVTVQCDAVPTAVMPAVTDNCDPAPLIVYDGEVETAGSCPDSYTLERTWTATDHCGNVTTCTQTITVVDTTAPSISCPAAVSVQCIDDVPAADTSAVTASDNCGDVTVTHVGDVSDGLSCPETITRTYGATDECGNYAECTQIITVHDTTPPSITCPAPVVVECIGDVPAVDTGAVTASDNCGAVTVTHMGDLSDGLSCPETITRTYRATDACGNFAECTQTITVDDTLAPVFDQTCPLPAITVYADAGACEASSATVSPITPTATDNCVTPMITFVRSDGKTALTDAFEVADSPITITWTAEDACGNTATCEQVVTVQSSSEMLVTVQLEWAFAGTRCITFELWDCGLPTPVEVAAELTFTAGTATDTIEVPCGEYECITARDTLHTLRSTDSDDFGISGTQYVADFTGDDKLIGGNLNDDQWVDILDFGVYSWQYTANPHPGADTTCTTPFPHADIDGIGGVGTGDFTFIQINFLAAHEDNCCGAGGLRLAGAEFGPRTEISTAELREMGLGHLDVADLNADGWVDQSDIAAFIMGARPQPKPQKPIPNPAAKRRTDLHRS